MYFWMGIGLVLYQAIIVAHGKYQDAEEYYPEKTRIVIPSVSGISTLQNRTIYPLTMAVNLAEFEILLELNEMLIPSGFTHKFYTQGKAVIDQGHVNCFYQGWVKDHPKWKATMSTCHGLEGVFGDFSKENDTYHIKPLNSSNHRLNQPHLLYVVKEHDENVYGHCGTTDYQIPTNNYTLSEQVRKNLEEKRTKRQNSLGEMIVELAVVVDQTQYTRHGSNLDDVRTRTFSTINWVDYSYRNEFNIRVVMVYLEIWSDGDLIVTSPDPTTFIKNFSKYKTQIATRHDVLILITGFDMTGYVYGAAYTRTMCSNRAVGINQDRRPAIKFIGGTVAHELGHILNMGHDDGGGCTCTDPSGKCIMAGVSSTPPIEWSDCSTTNLQDGFRLYSLDSCLYDEPEVVISNPVCGNGIREDGEDCDCGTIAQCTDVCCNPATCTLADGADCASGDCCDRSICTFHAVGTTCRTSVDACDVTEYCIGNSIYCPEDASAQDGTSCGSNYCYAGTCRSLNDQCRYHWRSGYGVGDTACFTNKNELGNKYGNCGHNPTTSSYIPCATEHVMCGQLQCRSGYFNDNYYDVPVIVNKYEYTRSQSGVFTSCLSFTVAPSEPAQSPGLVETGTKCAEGKVCYMQQCIAILDLPHVQPCPTGSNGITCSGNGRCNSSNLCFCNPPYSGDACHYQDVNECSTNNGGCDHICTDTVVSFGCSCNTGYSLTVDGLNCTDTDECQLNTDNCQQTCVNTAGGFTCSCNLGYTLNGDGKTCDDVNECATNNGSCAQTCTNTVGSFVCSCQSGYTLASNGLSCNGNNDSTGSVVPTEPTNKTFPGDGTGGRQRNQIVAGGVSGGLLGIALIGAIVIVIIVSIIIKKNQRKLPVNVTPTSSNSQRCDSENQTQHSRDLQQASADHSQSNQDTKALPDYLRVAQKMFPPSVTHSAVDIQSPTVSELPAKPGPSVVEDSCNSSTLSFHSAYTNTSYRQSEALDDSDEQSPKHEHHSELQIEEFSHDKDTPDPSMIGHKASEPSTSPVSESLERPTSSQTETQPSNMISGDIEQPCSGSQPSPNSRGQNTKVPSKTPNLDPLRAPFHSRLHRPSISSVSGSVPPKPISLEIAPSTQPPSNRSAHSSHSSLPPLRHSPRQGKLAPITSPGTPLQVHRPLSDPAPQPTNNSKAQTHSDAESSDLPRIRRPSKVPIPSPTITSPESTISHPVQSPSDAKSSNVTRLISRLHRPSTPSHSLTSTKPRKELGMPVTNPSVNVNPEVTRPIESTVIETTLQQQSHSPTETNSTTDSSTTRVGVRRTRHSAPPPAYPTPSHRSGHSSQRPRPPGHTAPAKRPPGPLPNMARPSRSAQPNSDPTSRRNVHPPRQPPPGSQPPPAKPDVNLSRVNDEPMKPSVAPKPSPAPRPQPPTKPRVNVPTSKQPPVPRKPTVPPKK